RAAPFPPRRDRRSGSRGRAGTAHAAEGLYPPRVAGREGMTDLTQLLQGYSLGAVKAIAAAHNASTSPSKAQIVEGLVKRLSDTKAVEALLIGLSPGQQIALQRAKQYGGRDLRLDLLRAQLGVDGIAEIDKVIASLARLGLLLQEKTGAGM